MESQIFWQKYTWAPLKWNVLVLLKRIRLVNLLSYQKTFSVPGCPRKIIFIQTKIFSRLKLFFIYLVIKKYIHTRRLYIFDTVPAPCVKIDLHEPNCFWFYLQVSREHAGSKYVIAESSVRELELCMIVVWSQAAQTLNTINTWHYAVGDCVTILAVYKTMYENASKITLNATCRK